MSGTDRARAVFKGTGLVVSAGLAISAAGGSLVAFALSAHTVGWAALVIAIAALIALAVIAHAHRPTEPADPHGFWLERPGRR